MRIVIEGRNGKLAIVSEMMCRVCVEALPEREIDESTNTDDPGLILPLALRYVNPKTISNHLLRNPQGRSELVFHHELYPTIRYILKNGPLTRGIYSDATTLGCPRRADILIENGVRMAYELKFNQLRKLGIEAAVKRADEYRQQFKVDRMLLANFVPTRHKLDKVYRLTEFPEVEVVHVRFGDSWDRFSLEYLGKTNEVSSCSVKCKQ